MLDEVARLALQHTALQGYLDAIAAGDLQIRRGPVFAFEDLRSAHEATDANRANGKIVVRVA